MGHTKKKYLKKKQSFSKLLCLAGKGRVVEEFQVTV
jgi:hypothetical protein